MHGFDAVLSRFRPSYQRSRPRRYRVQARKAIRRDWLETDYGKDTQRVAARVATSSAADYERELELTASNADTSTPYHAQKRSLMVNYVQMHKRGLVGWLKPARSVR